MEHLLCKLVQEGGIVPTCQPAGIWNGFVIFTISNTFEAFFAIIAKNNCNYYYFFRKNSKLHPNLVYHNNKVNGYESVY